MKRTTLAILVLVMVLAIAGSVIAAPKEEKDLQKLTFVHYIKPHGGPTAPTDEVTDYKLISGGVKLAGGTKYRVDTTDAPPGAASAIAVSVDEWQDYTQTDPIAGTDKSSENVLSWGRLQAGTIAVTNMWISTRTKTVVKFTITFNTYYPWSASGASGAMDVQNIATHELGHAYGLSDLYNSRDLLLTMYGYSDYGDIDKRTLGKGDALGVQKLYGVGTVWVTLAAN